MRFAAASILIEAGAPEYAKSVLTALVELHPTHVGFVITLVRCLRLDGMVGTARRYLVTALEAHPDEPILHTSLAQLDITAGMVDRADRVLEDALERFEHEPFERLEILFLRALAQGRAGRWTAFAHTAAAIRDAIPEGDHDARVHVFSRWIATAHQFADNDAQRAARVCYDQAHTILPDDDLKAHIDRIDAWIAWDDARRAALDDPAAAAWIKGLMVLVFSEGISDEENRSLFGPAIERHLENLEEADAEWERFASRHEQMSTEIEHVRNEARSWGNRLRPGLLNRLRSLGTRRVAVGLVIAGLIGGALGAVAWFAQRPNGTGDRPEIAPARSRDDSPHTSPTDERERWLPNIKEIDPEWYESLSEAERNLIETLNKGNPKWLQRLRQEQTPPLDGDRKR